MMGWTSCDDLIERQHFLGIHGGHVAPFCGRIPAKRPCERLGAGWRLVACVVVVVYGCFDVAPRSIGATLVHWSANCVKTPTKDG